MPWFGSRSSSKVDKSTALSEIQRQIPAIVQVNSQRQNWPATPTGLYGEPLGYDQQTVAAKLRGVSVA